MRGAIRRAAGPRDPLIDLPSRLVRELDAAARQISPARLLHEQHETVSPDMLRECPRSSTRFRRPTRNSPEGPQTGAWEALPPDATKMLRPHEPTLALTGTCVPSSPRGVDTSQRSALPT